MFDTKNLMLAALICLAVSPNNMHAQSSTWKRFENTVGNIAGTLLALRIVAPIVFAHAAGLRLS